MESSHSVTAPSFLEISRTIAHILILAHHEIPFTLLPFPATQIRIRGEEHLPRRPLLRTHLNLSSSVVWSLNKVLRTTGFFVSFSDILV